MDELRNRAAEAKTDPISARTVQAFIPPLYISSYCKNNCVYCAFKSSHRATRRRLTLEEILREAAIIKSYGIDSLAAGERRRQPDFGRFFWAEAVRELKKMFSYISIEIYPMEKGRLPQTVRSRSSRTGPSYQENLSGRISTKKLHPSGPKKRTTDGRPLRAPGRTARRAGFLQCRPSVFCSASTTGEPKRYRWRAKRLVGCVKKHWRTQNPVLLPLGSPPIPGGYGRPPRR